MITLQSLRAYMRSQLEDDRKIKSIRVTGGSLEEALKQASIELGVSVKKLEYEVVEQGSRGTLGVGRRNWVILAYEAAQKVKMPEEEVDLASLGLGAKAEAEPDRDGEVFVRLTHEGVMMKVTPPVGRGSRLSERVALEKLSRRNVNFDAAAVSRVVRRAEGEYIKVGDFEFNPAAQSVLTVDVFEADMKAAMTATPPGPGGTDLTAEEIRTLLASNGVVHGIKEEVIQEFVDYPRYNDRVVVAEGSKPVNGRDARVAYNFSTDHTEVRLKEKNGRVDFRELDLVENVEAGQILARKMPAEPGQDGRTVLGRVLPAKAGKDTAIDVGKNVKLSEDGTTVLATINGQVLLVAGKINVEPVYTVEGDVNFKSGNILFLGTVLVKGNVEDGFSVKAAGNIEVMGSVGKAELDAEGDIIVHQGILGKNEGRVRAGLNLLAKFIEHARAEADGNVLVSDGIIHSFVDANRRIICQGKRAAVVGGRLRAAEDINAKILGSVAGTETILEVGLDPRRKEQLAGAFHRKGELERELEGLERNLNTLENLKRVQGELPEDKARSLDELNERRSTIFQELETLNAKIAEINAYLAGLKINGKVSASDRVYPGVKIFIKNESLVVRNEFKKVTFCLEGKEVRMTKYEPVEEEFIRRT